MAAGGKPRISVVDFAAMRRCERQFASGKKEERTVAEAPAANARSFQRGEAWSPPLWANRLASGIVWLFGGAIGVFLVTGCMISLEGFHKSLAPIGLVLWIPLLYIGVAVHEAGHYLAARRPGMTVTIVQVGPAMGVRERAGWRWRSVPKIKKLAGYVVAYPHPGYTVRSQRLWMTIGGPLANIVAALVLGPTGYLLLTPRLGAPFGTVLDTVFSPMAPVHPVLAGSGALMLVLAGCNLAMGLINLVPKQGVLPSDGLQIVRWLRGMDENQPSFALQRLVGMSLTGVAADRLPADLLASLATLPAPAPIYRLWFDLAAHQCRGEWNAAAAMLTTFVDLLGTMNREMNQALVDVIAAIRCEIDFSRVVAGERLGYPIDRALTRNLAWFTPSLPPRLRALAAALAGDSAAMERNLSEYVMWAKRSFDHSIDAETPLMESAIRGRLGVAENQTPSMG